MLRFCLSVLACLAVSFPAIAGEDDVKRIKAQLAEAFPDLEAAAITPSPAAGIYEVEIESKIVYATSDGKYLFMGDLVDLGSRSNLTETRRGGARLRLLNQLGEAEMLVIGPDKPKRTVTVFTDVDCPYCSKFHLDVPTLNKAGVKVRYLLYPRAGIGSESYKRAVAVWCARDRAKGIGMAKAGEKLDMKTCANPVEKHYRLGGKLDIGGTPAIILDDGKVLPGYVPAPRLLAMLGLKG